MRESRELSTALEYQRALDHIWAATIAFLVDDRTATLQVGRRAIHALRWSGDRLRMGIILHLIAGAFAASRPDAAAIIQGAAEAYVVQAPTVALASSTTVTGALGDARARELRARGAEHGLGPGPRPTPSPRPPKPSTNANPRPSDERARPDHCLPAQARVMIGES